MPTFYTTFISQTVQVNMPIRDSKKLTMCTAAETFQPAMSRPMMLAMAGADQSTPIVQRTKARNQHSLQLLDERLKANKYLAREELTAADIMIVFTLTTMRQFAPLDLSQYENILRWLQECAVRPAYKTALQKGDAETVNVAAGVSGPGPRSFPPTAQMHEAQAKA